MKAAATTSSEIRAVRAECDCDARALWARRSRIIQGLRLAKGYCAILVRDPLRSGRLVMSTNGVVGFLFTRSGKIFFFVWRARMHGHIHSSRRCAPLWHEEIGIKSRRTRNGDPERHLDPLLTIKRVRKLMLQIQLISRNANISLSQNPHVREIR